MGYCDVMSLSTAELTAALEFDAAERLKAEAAKTEHKRREAEAADHKRRETASTEGSSPTEKKALTACLRKAGTIAKMSSAFRSANREAMTSPPMMSPPPAAGN